MSEQDLFLAALEIEDVHQRERFVSDACAHDPGLLQRVRELLAVHERSGAFLKTPALQQLAGQPASPSAVPPAETSADDVDLSFLEPAGQPDSLGRLAHYEVRQLLGRGACGIVLRAFDTKLHRDVAIKVMSPELATTSPARKRFLREARSTAAIGHENVVQIFSVEEQPLPFLVMEYIAGQTLQEKLNSTGPLEIREVVDIGRQLALGLEAAHARGLVHRDIKPANILLELATGRVKITDFGLARTRDDASLTQSGVISGTPLYMSPEQAQGRTTDFRSDLFSLGSVLYVMCTGRPPFRAGTMVAVLRRVVEETPRPMRDVIPEVPEWLTAIVSRLHAKQPAERFPSARAVAVALTKGEARRPKPPLPPQSAPQHKNAEGPPTPPAVKPRWQLRWLWTIPVTLVCALGLWGLPRAGSSPHLSPTLVADSDAARPGASPNPGSTAAPLAVDPLVGNWIFLHPDRKPLKTRFFPDGTGLMLFAESGIELVETDEEALGCRWKLLTPGIYEFIGPSGAAIRLTLNRDRIDAHDEMGRPFYATRLVAGSAAEQSATDSRLASAGDDSSAGDRRFSLVRTMTEAQNVTTVVTFTPDERYVIAASNGDHHVLRKGVRYHVAGSDNSVRVWNVETGALVHQFRMNLGQKYGPLGLSVDPQGRYLGISSGWATANGPSEPRVYIYDLTNGQRTHHFQPFRNHAMRSLSFSADGTTLSCVRGGPGGIQTWKIPSGISLPDVALKGVNLQVEAPRLSWSPDGRYILGSDWGRSGPLLCWDRTTGSVVKRFAGHRDTPRQAAMTADGTRVVSVADDRTLRIWDWATELELRQIAHPECNFSSVAVSRDGMYIAAGSNFGDVQLYELDTGRASGSLRAHIGRVNDVAFSTSGRLMATVSGDRTVKLWRIAPLDSRGPN